MGGSREALGRRLCRKAGRGEGIGGGEAGSDRSRPPAEDLEAAGLTRVRLRGEVGLALFGPLDCRTLPRTGGFGRRAGQLRALGQPLDDSDPRLERAVVLLERAAVSGGRIAIGMDATRRIGAREEPVDGLPGLAAAEP